MKCIKRMIVNLSLLSLLIPSFSLAGPPQDGAGVNVSKKIVTISGHAGLPGVVMKGLPGDPRTHADGTYSAEVAYGWTGTVTPTREGISFQPPSRSYTAVTESLPKEDYVGRLITYKISGSTGISGVIMKGLPGNTITDENGVYAATVEYGWVGKVVPEKEGYFFSPASREHLKVTHDLPRQDYKAEVRMVTISDRIKAGDEPIAEIVVTAEPGGQSVITDLQGRYAIQVPYGWTGRLFFKKEGFAFHPDNRTFTNVRSDIIDGKSVPSSERPTTLPPSRAQTSPRAILPSPTGNVFVIPTVQVVPEVIAETTEDLQVMLQILQEKVTEPRLIRGAFVDFGSFFDDKSRAFEAFHLQGSAAVFVLEMDSPFSFASEPPGEGESPKEAVDPVWQRARQKLYAPQTLPGSGPAGPTEQMDFPQFKEDLLKSLRHAVNLRHVEPNEPVILTIIARDDSARWPAGPASAGGSFSNRGGMWFEGGSYSTSSGTFGLSGGTSQADSRTYSRGSAAGQSRPGPRPPAAPATPSTALTIQAKKADIDAFAQGNLTFEQFQQRVKVFTY